MPPALEAKSLSYQGGNSNNVFSNVYLLHWLISCVFSYLFNNDPLSAVNMLGTILAVRKIRDSLFLNYWKLHSIISFMLLRFYCHGRWEIPERDCRLGSTAKGKTGHLLEVDRKHQRSEVRLIHSLSHSTNLALLHLALQWLKASCSPSSLLGRSRALWSRCGQCPAPSHPLFLASSLLTLFAIPLLSLSKSLIAPIRCYSYKRH